MLWCGAAPAVIPLLHTSRGRRNPNLTPKALRPILAREVERTMPRKLSSLSFSVVLSTVVVSLAGWSQAFAQNPAAAQQTQAEPASIQGTVIAAANGQPLRGARLMLVSTDKAGQEIPGPVSTDAEGRFTIAKAAPGRYHFFAIKSGYAQQAYRPDGTDGAETILELAAGQKVEKVLFRMRPAGVILGRIADESGEPVAGITVEALVSKIPSDDRMFPALGGQWLPVRVASTNDLGEYRLYGLPPGKYYVAAVDSGVAQLAESLAVAQSIGAWGFSSHLDATGLALVAGEREHATVYYPGVFQRAQAERVRVSAGQEMRIDIVLMHQKTVNVSGRVFDPAGKPSPQTTVMVRSTQQESRPQAVANTDAQGHFEVKGVAPGSYFASATGSYGEKAVYVDQPIEVGAEDVNGLHLQLKAGFEISGKVIVLAGAKTNVISMQIILWPSQQLEHVASGVMQEDRTFTISELRPGDYTLEAMGLPDGWYVSAADFGGENILEKGLKIGEAGARHQLMVAIKPGLGTIEGVVLKGDNPVSGAVVKVVAENASAYRIGLLHTTATDQRGHFLVTGVVPGSYRALAASREDGDDDDGDDAGTNDSSTTTISIAEGETKTVQLKLQAREP